MVSFLIEFWWEMMCPGVFWKGMGDVNCDCHAIALEIILQAGLWSDVCALVVSIG